MGKVITSPVKRWSGSVTLADPLTSAMAIEIERFISIEKDTHANSTSDNYKQLRDALDKSAKLPAILACVEKWELENFNHDPFPFSPRGDSHKLIDWLFAEIYAVYLGDSEIPNE